MICLEEMHLSAHHVRELNAMLRLTRLFLKHILEIDEYHERHANELMNYEYRIMWVEWVT